MSIFSLRKRRNGQRHEKLQVQDPSKSVLKFKVWFNFLSLLGRSCHFSSVHLSAGFVLKDVSTFLAGFFGPLFFPVVNGRIFFCPNIFHKQGCDYPNLDPSSQQHSATLSICDLCHFRKLSKTNIQNSELKMFSIFFAHPMWQSQLTLIYLQQGWCGTFLLSSFNLQELLVFLGFTTLSGFSYPNGRLLFLHRACRLRRAEVKSGVVVAEERHTSSAVKKTQEEHGKTPMQSLIKPTV